MKWSSYNIILNEDRKLLYNLITGCLIELSEDSFSYLIEVKENFESINKLDNQFASYLVEKKFYVADDEAEKLKIILQRQKNRFNNKTLSLTIAPTLACNFNCQYCFEENTNSIIDDDTIQNIIKFIKQFEDITKLDITWYGGEPLLAQKQISKINNEIKKLGLAYQSKIVTNGYLINEGVLDLFKSINLCAIQITLDGLEKTHNNRRRTKHKEGTFKRIIENIELILKDRNDIRINIRSNIDKSNFQEFTLLNNYLKEKFKGDPRLKLYPSFVNNHNQSNSCKSQSCFIQRSEKEEFILNQIKENKELIGFSYPKLDNSSCMARKLNSYLIDSLGDLYKCWHVVGDKKYVVGNINNKTFNEDKIAYYMVGADNLSDDECVECKYFPVCSGGCPLIRLENKYKGKKHDYCYSLKNSINKYLSQHANIKTIIDS